MKRNIKRLLASVLTLAIAFGDCGDITALAAEETVTAESGISENNTIIVEQTESEIKEENPPLDINVPSGTDTESQLPALHIGRIPEGERLPSLDDGTFIYDLPVFFETDESMILFSNYAIEGIPETTENGTLEWSILRGEKGLHAGSTSLLDEEDDWSGFEEVSSSPCFTLKTIEDKDGEYDQMMALTPGETVCDEDYDYYIRAAYFVETEEGKAEDFYAAATIPFVSLKTADAESETENIEIISENNIPDDETVSSNDLPAETSVSENNIDTVDGEISEDIPDDTLSAAESSGETIKEDTVSGNSVADQTAESSFTLSENNIMADSSVPSANRETPLLEEEPDGTLTLYQGVDTSEGNILDKDTPIYLTPGDTQQITARMTPAATSAAILWESSDDQVATVRAGANGTVTVTAVTEGYARITASFRGITASAVIDVVSDKTNPDNGKLLDLSGDIRVAGFKKESDDLVYNGQKITQDFRVYHKNTLLTEKIDYTLSYKNNINAARWNTTKAPSVTIKLKGQYEGSVTLYYTIKPFDINDIDITNADTSSDGSTVRKSPGYEQAVNYSKKLNIPAPVLTFGRKKLAVNKDFVCDYTTPGESRQPLPADYKNGDLYETGKTYSYMVNGTGNFTGSFPMTVIVLKDKNLNFSSASVTLDQKKYEYHGISLSKQDVKITEVKIGGQTLSNTLYDYEVTANGTEGAYVIVSPSAAGKNAGYRGCKKIALNLVGDRPIADTVPGENWKESIAFSQKTVDKNGGMFQTGNALLAFENAGKKVPLVEGIDYTIKYSNAKKVGNVTVTFKGMGRYTGTVSKKYTITANTAVKIYPGENVTNKGGAYEVAYQKNGAAPELILKDQEYTVLKNKTDYTIKYKDNKTPGTTMTCEITGKGNYKGYQETVTLKVTNGDISKSRISVSDKPYTDKPDKWQSTVALTDLNGQKLSAGKDYDRTLTYSHTQAQSPPAGTAITVTVRGIGCYEGSSITGTYRIFKNDIKTLKVVIDPQEYTGEEIKLEKSDIHVYANAADQKAKKELTEKNSCFEIIESEYKNNIKAGTAKVTLHGIGDYGGTKTFSFKIRKKKYMVNRVKKITLDKTSLSLSLAETNEEKRKITATITAETGQTITNPTVVWTSSNSSIVDIEKTLDNPPGKDAGGCATASSTVVLTLKKEGSVTITATAQDSGRKAQCKITVLEAAPILLEADTTIQKNIGETYQLHMSFASKQLTWESSNPEAVSVDKNGLLTMKKAGAAIIRVVYRSGSNQAFTQQCYAVALDPNEKAPEGEKILTYKQASGTTDDTASINKMLRDWEGNASRYEAMYIPAGVYHIDAVSGFGGIVLTDNQKLVMSPSALLVAIGTNAKNSHIIYAFGRKNVTISGGQIIGERNEHQGSGGEWGHGIEISGCTNVTIENVDISQCWGDGIWLGKYDNNNLGNPTSSDITITNCNLHHNRRNNLSITDASNVTVKNCEFNYANGTSPQYGIDIEPNVKGYICRSVTISDSTFHGNAGGTILILGQKGAHVDGVTIENCTGDKKPVTGQGYGGGGTVKNVTEKNNKWGN